MSGVVMMVLQECCRADIIAATERRVEVLISPFLEYIRTAMIASTVGVLVGLPLCVTASGLFVT